MMTFQMVGQSTAVGLGKSKQAIFFSIFRKVIIVAPLTVILPKFIGINGVFIAEAISNFHRWWCLLYYHVVDDW